MVILSGEVIIKMLARSGDRGEIRLTFTGGGGERGKERKRVRIL